VASHRLSTLPSVQTDERRHAAEAAREFEAKGMRNVPIAGCWQEGNTRHTVFTEESTSIAPGGRCEYVHLADDLSTADLYLFFVYDSGFESFTYKGMPPIRAATPSLSALGRRLAEKLIKEEIRHCFGMGGAYPGT
jgi:hypothetical protein